MNKKIILVGTDSINQKAIEYLGQDVVEAYALDDFLESVKPDGVDIISFDELSDKWRDYTIYVTAWNYADTADILRAKKIGMFKKYPVPNSFVMGKFYDDENLNDYTNIAIYGNGILEQCFIKQYNQIADNKITSIIDCGSTENELAQINACKPDCIIVANPENNIALENRLEILVDNKIKIINPFKSKTYYTKEQLVINKYENSLNEVKSEDEINKINANKSSQFIAINSYVREVKDNVPLFKLIEIETINRCNGVCEFCPVNKNMDPREKHIMSEDVFTKIVADLKKLNYSGKVSLFSNNEPLLDERIEKFSEILRNELPNAQIHMFTNGTLFTLEKFKNLIKNLDELIIDNYHQELKLIKPVKEIKEYCEAHPELIERVSIVMRKPKEILTSRGGDAPNRKERAAYPDVSCPFLFQQMIVRPTGEVSLCCNDPIGKYTLGDLSKASISEVWYGEKYNELRKKIANGRKNIEHCQYCDVFSLYL